MTTKRPPLDNVITIQRVTKTFHSPDRRDTGLRILRGVSFAVGRGEIVAVVGASGAGKSTLLHIVGTLDRPTSGSVVYDGVDVFSLTDVEIARFRNAHIGFVFQFHHLLPEFSVFENVVMPALIQGQKLGDVTSRATELLREVGLEALAGAKPSHLSGGEAQRVAVARALMNAPGVILADEPSGNLDSTNAENLHKLIWNLSRNRGQTFVIVTHNESLANHADRVLRIADGVVREL